MALPSKRDHISISQGEACTMERILAIALFSRFFELLHLNNLGIATGWLREQSKICWRCGRQSGKITTRMQNISGIS